MENKTKKFATAINCIDGRVQVPLADFIKANYNIDYVERKINYLNGGNGERFKQ